MEGNPLLDVEQGLRAGWEEVLVPSKSVADCFTQGSKAAVVATVLPALCVLLLLRLPTHTLPLPDSYYSYPLLLLLLLLIPLLLLLLALQLAVLTLLSFLRSQAMLVLNALRILSGSHEVLLKKPSSVSVPTDDGRTVSVPFKVDATIRCTVEGTVIRDALLEVKMGIPCLAHGIREFLDEMNPRLEADQDARFSEDELDALRALAQCFGYLAASSPTRDGRLVLVAAGSLFLMELVSSADNPACFGVACAGPYPTGTSVVRAVLWAASKIPSEVERSNPSDPTSSNYVERSHTVVFRSGVPVQPKDTTKPYFSSPRPDPVSHRGARRRRDGHDGGSPKKARHEGGTGGGGKVAMSFWCTNEAGNACKGSPDTCELHSVHVSCTSDRTVVMYTAVEDLTLYESVDRDGRALVESIFSEEVVEIPTDTKCAVHVLDAALAYCDGTFLNAPPTVKEWRDITNAEYPWAARLE